jgi:DNA-binding SARP family transcriptional activator
MGPLQISLFGYVQIVHPGRAAVVKIARPVQTMLAYLLLGRRRYHSREVLIDLFWGDHNLERARDCLSTTLWRLRRVLEPEGIPRGAYLLTTSTGEVGFNWDSAHWLDVTVFEEKVGRLLKIPIPTLVMAEAQELEQILQLHSGELLEGFYDDWMLRERERLRQLYLDGLAHLLRYYKHHQLYEQGLACGQQILACDSLRESIYREMMQLYWQSDQPDRAVRLYQDCCQRLADELHLAPMAETQVLYAQIVAAANQPEALPDIINDLSNWQQAMERLHQATQEFARAQQKLQQAIRLVERFNRQHQ